MSPNSRRLSLGLGLSGVLLVATPGGAGVLDASWTAPTTNTDGSSLTDLASYRVYYGTSNSPCPGSSFFQVASPTPSPRFKQTVAFRLTGLSTGALYYVSVTAVDTSGNESACSTAASAVARIAFAVSPTSTVDFGSVNLGSFANQTFTVSNQEPRPSPPYAAAAATGGGTVSGTVSTPAPFSIVSGSPFTLRLGASQAVTVRFTPTTSATATANVNFTADGDTISRIVTGSGTTAGGGCREDRDDDDRHKRHKDKHHKKGDDDHKRKHKKGDRDDNEELNWIRPGHHYGFPWRIGQTDTPQQFPGYDPSSDPFIGPGASAPFTNDPTYPPAPEGVVFTDPIMSSGPDADMFRDPADGSLLDASENGMKIGSLTAHRSPLGLTFDNDRALAEPYAGDGFVLSWTPGSSGLLNPMQDAGEDLLHITLNFIDGEDRYEAEVARIVEGFTMPMDAVLVGNKMYVLEMRWSGSADLWELSFPPAATTATEPRELPAGAVADLRVYPNPFVGSTKAMM